jgi:hypothetical protein
MAQAIALRAAIASEQEAFGRRISALEASRAEFLMRQRELLARVARLERQQDDASLVERLHANQLRAHSFDPAELRER